MGCKVIIRNCVGCEIGAYEINTSRPISRELIRVIRDEDIVVCEGDTISIECE